MTNNTRLSEIRAMQLQHVNLKFTTTTWISYCHCVGSSCPLLTDALETPQRERQIPQGFLEDRDRFLRDAFGRERDREVP